MTPPGPGTWLLVILVACACGVYARGVGRLWRRAGVGRGLSVAKAASFLLGLGALLIAIASPLDRLAHALFAAHMAQHIVLVLIAAPLLAYGAPVLAGLWALPLRARQTLTRRWNRARRIRQAWRALTHPLTTWALFAFVLWIWHLPSLYQAAVIYPAVHVVEHTTLLIASYLFWWPILQPLGRRRLDHGLAIVYVFATSIHVTMLGTVLSLAPEALYPIYAPTAEAFGTTALADQRVAAIVMRTPMVVVFVGSAAVLFLQWLAGMERRASGSRASSRAGG